MTDPEELREADKRFKQKINRARGLTIRTDRQGVGELAVDTSTLVLKISEVFRTFQNIFRILSEIFRYFQNNFRTLGLEDVVLCLENCDVILYIFRTFQNFSEHYSWFSENFRRFSEIFRTFSELFRTFSELDRINFSDTFQNIVRTFQNIFRTWI